MSDEVQPAAPNPEDRNRPYTTAIVGGGLGCKTFLQMAAEDKLGSFRLRICGVADNNPDAPGMSYARELGVELVTQDYKELYEIPDLELIIELTGSAEMRDQVERDRPRHVRLIDHFGATLFWEVYSGQASIIRQRTEMRARVEAEREWISQIFDSIPDEIVVVDNNMEVQDVNASFLRNNNLELSEVLGRHCYELDQTVRGECQTAVEDCPFFSVMKTKEPRSMVRKFFDDKGTPRYAAIVAAPLLDRQGAVIGMIESTRDISHRITLEEELKATEVQLKQFMEMAPAATYIKNRQGMYLEINPAACRLFGLKKSELLGKTDLEILPRATADTFRVTDKQVLDNGKEVIVYEEVELNGEHVHLSTVKYPVLDAQGRVTAVCGIAKDVTDLKHAEHDLRQTRDYLQNVLKNSPMIIITTDMDGRIVSFNPRAEECLGYPEGEVIGRMAAEFYEDPGERIRLMMRMKRDGTVRHHETTLGHKDGSRLPVDITISRLLDSDGEMIGTVGICMDISTRQALMDQVIQSERLAAVGRLAAGVAHEINNPLAIIGEISGYLGECLDDDPRAEDPETLVEFAEGLPKISNQVDRCRSITHRLLNFARKSEAKVEVAHVNAAMEEILPFLVKEARLLNISIHKEYDEGLPRVRIEEMQLQEVFINLINNAIQAIGDRGEGNIWLSTRVEQGKVKIMVRDDGPGIARPVLDRLFDPFVTTKAPGLGTGLGLSICYGIVRRYDGAITVQSREGVGTTFEVVLKVDTPKDPQPS